MRQATIIVLITMVIALISAGCSGKQADQNKIEGAEIGTEKVQNTIKYEVIHESQVDRTFQIRNGPLTQLKGFDYWKVQDGYMIMISRGYCGTPGYGMHIVSITSEQQNKTLINIEETDPETNEPRQQAVTFPYFYIKVGDVSDNFVVKNEKGEEYPHLKDNEARSTVEVFVRKIMQKDINGFKGLVNHSGLTIIRSFVSGNGTRGKDILNNYITDNIPTDLRFNIKGEAPVALDSLFKGSIQGDVKQYPITNIDNIKFNFSDDAKSSPTSINTIWELCGKIRALAGDGENASPKIIVMGGEEIILTESSTSHNMGSWAVFENSDGLYYLKAVMDFR